METIVSRQNSKIKQARALRQRKARQKSGLCLVEGIFPVGEALTAGSDVDYLLTAPDLLRSTAGQKIVRQAQSHGVPCFALPEDIFRSISGKEHPQGISAVVHQQWSNLDALLENQTAHWVALITPQDPGNIGTILRTLDAVGGGALILLDGGSDPYHPTAIRASMGTVFWHPLVKQSFAEFQRWAQQNQINLIGTSARAESDYREVHPAAPWALLMGSEQSGLSAEQIAACQQTVRLPIRGRVSSLNLAVATGVLLYALLDNKSS